MVIAMRYSRVDEPMAGLNVTAVFHETKPGACRAGVLGWKCAGVAGVSAGRRGRRRPGVFVVTFRAGVITGHRAVQLTQNSDARAGNALSIVPELTEKIAGTIVSDLGALYFSVVSKLFPGKGRVMIIALLLAALATGSAAVSGLAAGAATLTGNL
ncbi:hypothetical protein [Nocardia terpenica]|uniref:hypothetical protein n=1 Tax=Nocardia terpenica TaxID=455432 RepID=UPI0012E97238|nr:hypothetical protein [Nocardia terpenica]NQE91798.1 hypothetical protein [Nocardia terpenica]